VYRVSHPLASPRLRVFIYLRSRICFRSDVRYQRERERERERERDTFVNLIARTKVLGINSITRPEL